MMHSRTQVGHSAEMTAATSAPFFSVVVPCFNALRTLRRALESCFRQTERAVEILVIDDASRDGTQALLAELSAMAPADMPVRAFSMPVNGGPSKARNFGWDRAAGRYVAFLDADDCWDADRLERLREQLERMPEVLLLGHPHRQLGEARNESMSVVVRPLSVAQLLMRNIAQTSCIVVARTVPLRFDTAMRFTEDHDLWLRIARLGPVVRLEGLAVTQLGRPQMSAGGLSGRRWDMRRGELQMYIKAARADVRLLPLLPGLLGFSLCKHLWSSLRLSGQAGAGQGAS